MRWPFRRSTTTPTTTKTTPPNQEAGVDFDAPASAPEPTDSPPAFAPPTPAPPPPRGDWAKVQPLHVAATTPPPLTFHGDTFGRNVAGGRSLHAVRHRRPAASAPSGVLLNIAEVEAVVPTPTIPEVHDQGELPEIVHRKAPVAPEAREPTTPLVWSDVEVDFRPPEPLHVEPVTTISWTADDGFIEPPPTEPSNMRLVGQRGSYDDAISTDAPDEPTAGQPEASDENLAVIRYVPEVGPREERTSPSADVVSAVADATGVDVGDASIVTSRDVDERAAELGAMAYTESGAVHLAGDVGPVDAPAAKAIVAHELTHVAQQRKLGGDMPAEDSDEGRALEAEARDVQRSFATGDPVAPTFIRRTEDRPIAATPAGVQRFAPGEDPYAWQNRPEPPNPTFDADHDGALPEDYDAAHDVSVDADHGTGGEDENAVVRRERWAAQFEREHAGRLQHVRDERYRELVEQRRREAGGAALAPDDHQQLRDQLDEELPFQFAVPPGIEPYPRVAGLADGATDAQPSRPARREQTRLEREASLAGTRDREIRTAVNRQRQVDLATALTHVSASEDFDAQVEQMISDSAQNSDVADWRARLVGRRKSLESRLRQTKLAERRVEALRNRPTDRPVDDFLRDVIRISSEDLEAIRQVVESVHPLEDARHDDFVGLEKDASIVLGTAEIGPFDREPVRRALPDATDEGESGDEEAEAPTDSDAPRGEADAPDQPGSVDANEQSGTNDSVAPAAADAAAELPNVVPTPEMSSAPLFEEPDTPAQAPQHEVDDDGSDPADALGAAVADISELDLEALSRRLYGRLRRDLRRELLIDRERAGSLADVC